MSNTVSKVLQAYIYSGDFTADELADAGEVSDSMFAKYRTGERPAPFDVIARISRHVQKRRGRCELANIMNAGGYVTLPVSSSAPNGEITDEVCEAVTHLGDVARHFAADDMDAAERAVEDLLQQAQAALSEIALRRGRTGT